MYNNYPQNGVIVTPSVLADGDKATVLYKGLLYHSGADAVYMSAGHGYEWKFKSDVKMHRTAEGFESTIPIQTHGMLHMAFRDSAGNWDNNSSRNYNFEVQEKR